MSKKKLWEWKVFCDFATKTFENFEFGIFKGRKFCEKGPKITKIAETSALTVMRVQNLVILNFQNSTPSNSSLKKCSTANVQILARADLGKLRPTDYIRPSVRPCPAGARYIINNIIKRITSLFLISF